MAEVIQQINGYRMERDASGNESYRGPSGQFVSKEEFREQIPGGGGGPGGPYRTIYHMGYTTTESPDNAELKVWLITQSPHDPQRVKREFDQIRTMGGFGSWGQSAPVAMERNEQIDADEIESMQSDDDVSVSMGQIQHKIWFKDRQYDYKIDDITRGQ